MWKELVLRFEPVATFAEPALGLAIADAEEKLGVKLPDELRELLKETDGAWGEYSLGLVWPLARIVTDNLQFRTTPTFRDLYMPFDPLLFIGDAGNGDQFGYAILDGVIRRNDVYVWNHEDDSRAWVAPRLKEYIEWWLTGRIKV